eukprot:18299-Heterococcus_DN1.PRE.3
MKRTTACALSCAAGAATACITERQLHTSVPLATDSTAAATVAPSHYALTLPASMVSLWIKCVVCSTRFNSAPKSLFHELSTSSEGLGCSSSNIYVYKHAYINM